MMDHPRIDEEEILDHYLAGRLPAEEEARFEEHLFECAECLEKVRWGEELRRGLREVVTEDAARAGVALGLVAWLRRRRPAQLVALATLATMALALVVLPSAIVLRQRGKLRGLQEEAREAGRGAAAASGGVARPLSDFLVVSLGVVRGAGAPEVELRSNPAKDAVLLSLELEAVGAASYRVTLRDEAGGVLWRGEDLAPNLYDTLLVALPSAFLAPGRYRITVEAHAAGGVEPAGEVRLRVLPPGG